MAGVSTELLDESSRCARMGIRLGDPGTELRKTRADVPVLFEEGTTFTPIRAKEHGDQECFLGFEVGEQLPFERAPGVRYRDRLLGIEGHLHRLQEPL